MRAFFLGIVSLAVLAIAATVSVTAVAQTRDGQKKAERDSIQKVYLIHSNTLSFDKAYDTEIWTEINEMGEDVDVEVQRQVVRGDVVFRQDSAYMYCDMAFFYQQRNSFKAFGNVRVEQGDTLRMYCDSLFYDGDQRFCYLYDHVRLEHNDQTLLTEYMTYDRVAQEAQYPFSGTITDPHDHLKSSVGWYYPNRKEAFFQYQVELRSYPDSIFIEPTSSVPSAHPQATLYSDTLRYSFQSNDARVLGTSRIVMDTATCYTTMGIMNSRTLQSHLFHHSYIVSPGRYATADTLYYDGKLGEGDAWGHVEATDTLQSMKLTGDYAHYINDPQSIMVTGHALAMEYSSKDTLYLHADTLRAFSVPMVDTLVDIRISYDTLIIQVMDTIHLQDDVSMPLEAEMSQTDSLPSDTILSANEPSDITLPAAQQPDATLPAVQQPDIAAAHDSVMIQPRDSLSIITHRDSTVTIVFDTLRYMDAYYNVRYYRTDLQGICDSLHYSVRDSLATFVGNPVMWNDMYQITGDTIFTYMDQTKGNGGIKRALIHDNALLIQERDTIHYDQIGGQHLICYFDSSKVRKMDMDGSVNIIYYPDESDGMGGKQLIGLNQIVGNYLSVWFKNQKMDQLCVWPDVVGSLTPLPLVTRDILYLDKFRWMDYLRPTDPMDVFRDVRMKEEDKTESKRLFDEDELNGY